MKKTFSESGVIGNDGKLRLPMGRLKTYLENNRGTRVIVTFEAAEQGSTEAQQGYYYKYVLPAIVDAYYQQGTRITADNVDSQLLWLYPGELQTTSGKFPEKAKELTKTQMSDFLDWLKQFAAENFNVYIEDPKTI